MFGSISHVVNTQPDFLVGYEKGQPVLVPAGMNLAGRTAADGTDTVLSATEVASTRSLLSGAGIMAGLASPLIVFATGKPTGIAPSGTISSGNPGTVVFGTALPETYPVTISMYFPAVGTLAAGFYDVDMSSTTAGTLTGTDVVTGGAYTGDTTERTIFSYTLPANLMGANGELEIDGAVSFSSSTSAKTYKVTMGGSNIFSQANSTSGNVAGGVNRQVFNRNSESRQILRAPQNNATYLGAYSAALTTLNVDTTADTTIAATAQIALATDTLIWQYLQIRLMGY